MILREWLKMVKRQLKMAEGKVVKYQTKTLNK